MPGFAMRILSRVLVLMTVSLGIATALAQQATPPEPPAPPVISPHARLMAARTIFIEHAGGRLPNDVIGDAFQGWGRYTVVGSPAKADLIASINAPLTDSGVSVSSSTGATRVIDSDNILLIRLNVLDAHDRVVLWTGNERPKSSVKEHQREDNIVESSLKLFRRFRASIEPESAP